jgi:hypothetical protein
MVNQQRATIVCIQESKLAVVDNDLIVEAFGPQFANNFCFLPAVGTRGGVILAASADYFDLSEPSCTLHTVSAKITMRANGKAWSVSAVYGPQTDEEKFLFIEELKSLKGTVLQEWLLLGDFNLLVKESDKSSRNVNMRLIASFRVVLNFLEMAEIRLHGRRFTWTSTCAAQTKSKIDHCFASVEWRLLFPQSHLCAITSSMSDHCIMKLTGQLGLPSFKGFRFEDYWLKQRGFMEVVAEAWSRPIQAGDHIRKFHIKLSRVAKALRIWSRARVGNIKLLTAVAEQVILGLDFAQENRELTIAEIALRKFLKLKIVGLAAISRSRIRQRSRVTWVGAADANTKLFHLRANGRRRKNYVPLIITDDAHLTTEEDKHGELFRHFKESLGTTHRRQQTLNWDALGIQRHDLTSLEQAFSELELKDAVFGLPIGKAPGPDGFTAGFYRKCWPLIKDDLLLAINQLHSLRGRRWNLLNSAHISLLPKGVDACKVKDYRPVSLMHSVAKIVCKMMANRLAPCLHSMIPHSQSAFIKSRSIHDNFLYVKNAIKELQRKRNPCLFLKLDIAGAFDSVSWEYMLELMERLGFGPRWRDLLSLIWSTSSSRIMANGRTGEMFRHKRGLRQGDPLSPMLFTVAIAPLHWMLQRADEQGALSPVKLPAARLRTSLYADDAALFVNPNQADIHTVAELLQLFGHASGLRANLQKCAFYPIRCTAEEVLPLLAPLQVPVRSFPCQYLGLPLHHRKLTKAELQPIIDSVAARLPKWRGKLLNAAARLALVNSVLSAVPIYMLTVFQLGKWAIKRIDKIRRDFLWKSKNDDKKGVCLVNWKTVCRPKSMGGLGILDLHLFSRALRLRWKWYEWTDRKRPWVGSKTPCDSIDSSLFDACTKINIGRGNIAKFWTSRWLDGAAPADIAPSLYNLTRLKKLTVEQAMANDRWMTGMNRINSENQLREYTMLWIKLQGLDLTDEDDQIVWNLTASGKYSAASAYKVQFAGSFSPVDYSKLWRSKVQPKCKFFMWLWLRRRILTDDQLQTRKMNHGDICMLCDQEKETATHLILDCAYARVVWHLLAQWTGTDSLNIQRLQFATPGEWWRSKSNSLSRDELIVAIYAVWHIWKERCRRVFQNSEMPERQLLERIKDDILILGTYLQEKQRGEVPGITPDLSE